MVTAKHQGWVNLIYSHDYKHNFFFIFNYIVLLIKGLCLIKILIALWYFVLFVNKSIGRRGNNDMVYSFGYSEVGVILLDL